MNEPANDLAPQATEPPGKPPRKKRDGTDAKPPKREKRSYATELAEMTKERDALKLRQKIALDVLQGTGSTIPETAIAIRILTGE
jgi:hypothetical protein